MFSRFDTIPECDRQTHDDGKLWATMPSIVDLSVACTYDGWRWWQVTLFTKAETPSVRFVADLLLTCLYNMRMQKWVTRALPRPVTGGLTSPGPLRTAPELWIEPVEFELHRVRICVSNRQLSICLSKCFQYRPTLVELGVELCVLSDMDDCAWGSVARSIGVSRWTCKTASWAEQSWNLYESTWTKNESCRRQYARRMVSECAHYAAAKSRWTPPLIFTRLQFGQRRTTYPLNRFRLSEHNARCINGRITHSTISSATSRFRLRIYIVRETRNTDERTVVSQAGTSCPWHKRDLLRAISQQVAVKYKPFPRTKYDESSSAASRNGVLHKSTRASELTLKPKATKCCSSGKTPKL